MSLRERSAIIGLVMALVAAASGQGWGQVRPGDVITEKNVDKATNFLSPGNVKLVRQGMRIDVVATGKLQWPPPYRAATEKYSSQVVLAPNGELKNYVSGQPFPLLDPNDPQVATKILWNFSFRPMYSDDIDARYAEVGSYGKHSGGEPISYFTVGHFAFYNNVGRIEIPPVPTDPEGVKSGIRYRFGFYPFLEPSGLRGFGIVRYRNIDPKAQDNVWVFNPQTRRLRRQSPEILSDAIGGLPGFSGSAGGQGGVGVSGGSAYSNTIDPDSYFGFAAKIEDFTYKFLGDRPMLACVHARNSPARPCPNDGGRTICPENWEKRQLYVIEADAKPHKDLVIPKRILYIDAEGWFITASDQYDRNGSLWKTIAVFHTYRDRPVPDARVAIYPYKRMFQVALVDEDLLSGASSVVYMPGPHTPERECWYIDMGTVSKNFFTASALKRAGH